MAFTGRPGTASSFPSNIVPMFGAGGTKRAQSVGGSLSFSGGIASSHIFVFTQVSVTFYRAVNRAKTFVTIFRTMS